jgi:replicative DNA helicase
MGKTAICLNMAQHVGLRTDKSVGFFSMEMSKEALVIRMLCADALIDIKSVRTGFISDRELERLRLSAEALTPSRIFLDETPALTLMEMKAKARRLKMEGTLDIVFVDYIQLMRAGGRFENRNQEMSFISRSLKELAKELSIPVVGISQLSRAPEKMRREPRPMLSDLRESGAIEQDADVVIFIFRPEMYLSPEERESQSALQGIAEVIVAKQRNGPTGTVKLAFQNKFARFENLEYSYEGSEA